MKQFSNFTLHMYTEIAFGKGAEAQTGALVKKYAGTKALLVYGGGSVFKSGLYDRVCASLKENGIEYVDLSGVKANPRRTMVDRGVEIAREQGIDFILAIGGGSVIDTAKAIGYALKYEGNWWDMFCGKGKPNGTVPVGAILTITAAGSESSTHSIIVDDIDTHIKRGLASVYGRPVFAVLNPELTYSVSPYQTSVGSTDVFAHTLERYFYHDDCGLGDEFAEGLMRNVLKYGAIAYKEPENYEARAEMMLAGSFSHNDITGIGHTGLRGGPHSLETHISGYFDSAHGAGLAVIMPAWLKRVADSGEKQCARVAKLAIAVFGVTPDLADMKAVAYEGIDRFKAWLKQIGMPLTLRELGNKQEDILTIAQITPVNANQVVAGYIVIPQAELYSFYESIY